MEYGMIVLMIILQLVLHGYGESVLSCNTNIIIIYLFFADVPTILLKNHTLHGRWEQILFQVMHITNTLGILDNSDS